MLLTLLPKTEKYLEKYFSLKVINLTISCPYFQNINHGLNFSVFVGKGDPYKIEEQANKIFMKGKKKFDMLDSLTVKYYMMMSRLGIDCSGFVSRVVDQLLKESGVGGIRKNLHPDNKTFLGKLKYYIRPFSNISANTLTSDRNCARIEDLSHILPCDLIRFGRTHVAIITSVLKKNNKIQEFEYAHSTYDYLDQFGVKKGKIVIVNPNQELLHQHWKEEYMGRNWNLKDYKDAPSRDRGIRRIKALVNRVTFV